MGASPAKWRRAKAERRSQRTIANQVGIACRLPSRQLKRTIWRLGRRHRAGEGLAKLPSNTRRLADRISCRWASRRPHCRLSHWSNRSTNEWPTVIEAKYSALGRRQRNCVTRPDFKAPLKSACPSQLLLGARDQREHQRPAPAIRSQGDGIGEVSHLALSDYVGLLNYRLRKRFGYCTPNELFNASELCCN